MGRARVMLVQIDRQLQTEMFIRSDGLLEKFLLDATREVRPEVQRSVSDDGLES